MSNNLFFLPMIARALEHKNADVALRDAFEQIRILGQQKQYRRGYRQFSRFMEEAAKAEPVEVAERLLTQFCQGLGRPGSVEILIERGGILLVECRFQDGHGRQTVDHATPGPYRIKFETGRVIWEGDLTPADLVWAEAFPGHPLKLAADTGEGKPNPSRQIPLLDGSIVLHIYPGIEYGTLEIELTKP